MGLVGALRSVRLIYSLPFFFKFYFSNCLGVDAIFEICVRISDRGSGESRASGRSSHLRSLCAPAREFARVDPEFSMAGKILSLVKMKHEAKNNIDETKRIGVG